MKKFTFLFVFALLANLIIGSAAFGQIAQRGTATNGFSTNTNLTITKPTGVVAGDVMIVNIAKYGNTANDPSLSGWSPVTGATGIIGDGIKGSLLYKKAADVCRISFLADTLMLERVPLRILRVQSSLVL
ncbi:MAG: hypothetical protein IPQ06_06560 [Chitinophagaceae bacterium]|nr:hypothetical protein [Chitinophagaceae bacterium]